MVRERGLEPPRVLPHKILSLARLPVPPLPHAWQLTHYTVFCSFFFAEPLSRYGEIENKFDLYQHKEFMAPLICLRPCARHRFCRSFRPSPCPSPWLW